MLQQHALLKECAQLCDAGKAAYVACSGRYSMGVVVTVDPALFSQGEAAWVSSPTRALLPLRRSQTREKRLICSSYFNHSLTNFGNV